MIFRTGLLVAQLKCLTSLGRDYLNLYINLCMMEEGLRRGLPQTFQLDLLVEKCIIAALKAVAYMYPVYKAQLLSYLKISGMPKGLLINFHTETISHSVISLVTPAFATLPRQ